MSKHKQSLFERSSPVSLSGSVTPLTRPSASRKSRLTYVDVTGSELGLLIGPRGVTLDALQELARTVIQRRSEEHAARVTVDVAGFRAKRGDVLAVRLLAG